MTADPVASPPAPEPITGTEVPVVFDPAKVEKQWGKRVERERQDKRLRRHEVAVKALGRVTEEELAQWERAARVQFLDTFVRFVVADREFYDRVDPLIRQEDGFDQLSSRDWEYWKELRTKVYTFGNMGVLSKVMGPEDRIAAPMSITVNLGNDAIESDAAHRSAARELLSQFSARDKYIEAPQQETIEGKVLDAVGVEQDVTD